MNTHYLPSGANFIINPELEHDPIKARQDKKLFCLSLNTTDLSTDKQWTSDAVRKLATGLVNIGADGKSRATKAILVERLTKYIQEERAAILAESDADVLLAKTTLESCAFSTAALSRFIEIYSGSDLVDAIVGSILRKGYTNATVVKTIIPDIIKVVNAEYHKEDKLAVTRAIHDRFRAAAKEVDLTTTKNVVEKTNNRKATNYAVLYEGCDKIFKNIESATWKELSFALAFATGRRCAEIHGIDTKFTYVDDSHLIFEGQLKTKDRGDIAPYEIPVLYDATTVVRAWEKLRELGRASYTPAQVSKILSKGLSTEMPVHLKKLKLEANIQEYKDLRDTYAAKVSMTKPDTISQNAFLAKIMGHGVNDIQTASTYDKRYIA